MNPLCPQRRRVLALLCLAPLAGCHLAPETGPEEIVWDRDTCKRCGMAISDHHFAAQVRGGPKHWAYKFDDVGCALIWLKDQPWAEAPDTEIWVADLRSGEWLDARQARFVAGKTSPMGYGFGALKEAAPGSIDFATLRSQILAHGRDAHDLLMQPASSPNSP